MNSLGVMRASWMSVSGALCEHSKRVKQRSIPMKSEASEAPVGPAVRIFRGSGF